MTIPNRSVAAHAKFLILLGGMLLLPVFSWAQASQYSRVQASHTALQAAQRDYQARKWRGGLSTREDLDYQAYIAQLRQRFFKACAELDRSGPNRREPGSPCAAVPPRAGGAAAIDQAGEQTADERTAALQRELDESLSEFDEMLLVEQERVKAATPPPAARSSEGPGFSGGEAGTGGRAAGGSDAADGEGTEAQTTQGVESTAGADRTAGESRPGRASGDGGGEQPGIDDIPADIPEGSDDDVVARQLREAAMQETDPELRARLWEEYRRYKRGSP